MICEVKRNTLELDVRGGMPTRSPAERLINRFELRSENPTSARSLARMFGAFSTCIEPSLLEGGWND